MDTQITEILGEQILIAQLLNAGLEVARPLRDRGIDLLVYQDSGELLTRAVQLKVYSEEGFCVMEKYAQFHGLLMVYIWHIHNTPVLYALTCEQGKEVAQKMGWLETKTWKDKNHYYNNKPSKKLKRLLQPYEVQPKQWSQIMFPR